MVYHYAVMEEEKGVTVRGPGVEFMVPYGSVRPSRHNNHLSDRGLAVLVARERALDLNIAYEAGQLGLRK